MSAVVRRIINTTSAAKAIGPYNQAVVVDKTMYISGQIGLDPATMTMVPGGVEGETNQALRNMGEILKAAGASYSSVVKTTVLLADMDDFVTVNNIYADYFKDRSPARAAFQAARLPKDARVEIEAIAVIGDIVEH